mmetsp:Transcript_19972/g.23688  ORF Transcript_19972/g.23688 Transcript_19972/m.23688 type:complete len:91 (+) Transcript_19972:1169-1441(+)
MSMEHVPAMKVSMVKTAVSCQKEPLSNQFQHLETLPHFQFNDLYIVSSSYSFGNDSGKTMERHHISIKPNNSTQFVFGQLVGVAAWVRNS